MPVVYTTRSAGEGDQLRCGDKERGRKAMAMREVEDKSFGPKEAEGMVSRLREHLREADRLSCAGQASAAAQQESAANALVEGIITKLKRRLERYARSYFAGNEDTVEDAIVAMTLEVCRRLKNLTSYGAFEGVFNLCVKHAVIDAVKKVRRENGLDERGQPDTEGYQLVSGETLFTTDGEVGPSWEEQVPDPVSSEFVARVLGDRMAASLIARLPTPRHRRVFGHRLAGMEWNDIASREGISGKTAKKYYDDSKAFLHDLVLSTDS